MVEKARKGNAQAFLKIFQQYEADIYRMAYVYVNNQEDALDIVQEVAYQSFKNIHTLKNPEYFKTWLTKITINQSLNLVKKNSRVVQLSAQLEEQLGSDDEDILFSISLQDMLDILQEDEKSVVLLRFYQNMTFKEVAQVLDIPLGTAKSVLYRAINKLRNEMKEADVL